MKRYGHLFEQVIRFDNLLLAAHKAFRGKKKKDRVARFYFHMEKELLTLQEELISGSYLPLHYRSFEISEPKRRKICAADFRDRVVHHAICNVLEPIFEKRLIFDTYACRPGKGVHSAVKRAQMFSRRYAYFLKCDIRSYFASVDHAALKSLLLRIVKDKEVISLLWRIIDHPLPGAKAGRGLPIGNLTSQHFANLYLGELDHYLKDRLRFKAYLRYMDDFLLFADEKPELHIVLSCIRQFLNEKLLLSLKESALILAPVSEGLPFLGFRIFPGTIRLNRRSLIRFRRGIRECERAYRSGEIDVDKLAKSAACMVAHISHANSVKLSRSLLQDSLYLG